MVAGSKQTTDRSLRELARLHGIQLSYQNILDGRRSGASPEVLMAILRALGLPVLGEKDIEGALRESRRQLGRRGSGPVAVAWDGRSSRIRVPVGRAKTRCRCLLRLENGDEKAWEIRPVRAGKPSGAAKPEAEEPSGWLADIQLSGKLPHGYHQLSVMAGSDAEQVLIISAPRSAYVNRGQAEEKSWGVFMPVYALRSNSNWGVGDLGDLSNLRNWTHDQGGSIVGTLPMLASFLDEPFDPSPYSPVSRMFWNELFLDMGKIPELDRCPAAQEVVRSRAFQAELAELRSQPQVDYRRAMALKRKVLELLASSIFDGASTRREELLQYVKAQPELEDYARFRATCDRRRASWWTWPERLRDGKLTSRDYNMEAVRYHLYVQWLAEEQIRGFTRGGGNGDNGLYLDLPLGVNPDGYDVWRYRSSFALDASAGSPPDSFFTRGQDWGFPPMHPEKIREDGYGYFRKALEHHLSHTRVLRLDHVMNLHRLFWVPKGFEPREGAYVHYRAHELYAILALESVRNHALIVGEDLGTVPGYVRPALKQHGVRRMYVMQFEANPSPTKPLPDPPASSLASLNTHDMPTFAGFWEGLDVQDRVELGLLDEAGAARELAMRSKLRNALVNSLCPGACRDQAVAQVVKACLLYLASSRSRMVIVNLEDLWFEKQPQNVPGTCTERPNWKRKARYSLEEIAGMEPVAEMLRMVDAARRGMEVR